MPEFSAILLTAIVSASSGALVPMFWRRTIGTRFRTDAECMHCETRAAVDQILAFVVELAIKAGVDAAEIAKLSQRTRRP